MKQLRLFFYLWISSRGPHPNCLVPEEAHVVTHFQIGNRISKCCCYYYFSAGHIVVGLEFQIYGEGCVTVVRAGSLNSY